MHQIYSCSDENIEVFTTVIPSKVSSPARRRVKSSQHLLTKNVVIDSDLYASRPLELLPRRTDRQASVLEAPAPSGSDNRAVLTRGSRHLKKMTEEYPTLPQGAEASLPLTGSVSCGIPSILRKMWMRHKKKAEYVGATNSAFEAD
uniref:Vexin n=1 Tax=Myotis myotis TaxID=51298 RepID=A0A7J7TJZ9_MYOMY|nr:vexin [Myotis myotis]